MLYINHRPVLPLDRQNIEAAFQKLSNGYILFLSSDTHSLNLCTSPARTASASAAG